MSNFIQKIGNKEISRRTFLKSGAVATAGLGLAGCGNDLVSTNGTDINMTDGEWIPAACWLNCGGKCVNKAYVVDNVVLRQKTDDSHEDSFGFPQQRSCPRGRSLRKVIFNDNRVKYPMKRKNWSPDEPNAHLRGKDEWERITWDEALDYVADELIKAKAEYGNRSIFMPSWYFGISEFNEVMLAHGGYSQLGDTASVGTYGTSSMQFGIAAAGIGGSNDKYDLENADTIVLQGCNPSWASPGTPSLNYLNAKNAGTSFIFIGPSYNETCELLDARWIKVRPGTDTAFMLAVVYSMLEQDDVDSNPLIDWDFLHKCCVGFDAESMPAAAETDENFMDYVLGKYDGIPKTPEWASEIAGTSTTDIKWYANEIRKSQKVMFHHSFSFARCNGADNVPQLFMTVAAMGGHYGKSGHCCGSTYHKEAGNAGTNLITCGTTGRPYQVNQVADEFSAPTVWESILNKKYFYLGVGGVMAYTDRDVSVCGWQDIDIKVIYNNWRNTMQTVPGAKKAIEAFRSSDVNCVITNAFEYNATAQYSDILLPITTMWERKAFYYYLNEKNREIFLCPSKVIEPMYEAQGEQWIGEQLCERLGLDKDVVYPYSVEQQYYNYIAGATIVMEDGINYEPLATITEADIAEWGVVGTPQTGRVPISELMEAGIYQVPRAKDDNFGFIANKAFVEDPEASPLYSESGKLEIYCRVKAKIFNSRLGYGEEEFQEIKPYPNYIVPVNGYEESFSDFDNKVKGDYPFQIYNPHYYRRAHTGFDAVDWLREALPNPVYLNATDAAAKGISDGDTVLITGNSTGQVLRKASLTERMMPGCVSLPHGTWMRIDEETGIDSSGSDNYIADPKTMSCGVSGYNTNLCNYELYTGTPLEEDAYVPASVLVLDGGEA